MPEMTTSEAIEVLRLLNNYKLYHSLDSEQIQALDKAIEVMGREIYTDMISVADLNTLNELRVKQNNLKNRSNQ